MAKATLYARIIEQPNRNERYYGHSCGTAFDNYGNSEGVRCANCSDNRYYHEWSWIENLKEPNKPTQCGRPNGKPACNHATYYGIAGYRNVCPIAGCSGTYNRPATIKLSGFDFASLGINSNSTIYSITVNWQHRCRGVNVSTTNETTNSPPNFDGFGHYPDRTVVESYFAKGDEVLAYLHGLNGLRVGNPPNSDSFQGVGAATAYGLKASDILDPNFALHIKYGQNLSTNPGNLYVKDICITIEYQNGEPAINASNQDETLYTNEDRSCNCYTTIEHTVIAGWLYLNGSIEEVMQNKPLTIMLDSSNCPENVSVIDLNPDNPHHKTFKIEDHSGIEGEKYISYYIKEYPEKRVDVKYTAKKYNKPKIDMVREYIKDAPLNSDTDWQLYEEGKSYISAKGGCSDYIYVWIDTTDKSPDFQFGCLYPNKDDLLMYDSQGNRTNAYQEQFYTAIQNLNCGTHRIFVKNGTNNNIQTFVINLSPAPFTFTITDSETGDWQQDRTSNGKKNILIQRTDNVNIKKANIIVEDRSQNNPSNPNPQVSKQYTIEKNQVINHKMYKYYAGTFPITVRTNTTNCTASEVTENFTVIPYHKQYYDTLFVRGEDSTSFDYDYLVAWKGDDVRVPIKTKSVELGASVNDIKIYVNNAYTGISETGLLPIKITNIGGRGTIENLQIELNMVDIAENNDLTVTTDDWELPEGLFYKERLIQDFYTYNESIKNNVSLKIDKDNQNASDAENVYLYIKQLQEDNTIEVLLPFESRTPRTGYLQFLIFEEVQDIYWDGCSNDSNPDECKIINNPKRGINNIIKIKVLDSIATNLEIIGDTDILNTNLVDCPIECYTTDLTYRITNIDSSNLRSIESIDGTQKALTKIQNSLEMVPYKFTYGTTTKNINEEDWVNGVFKESDDIIFYRKPFDKKVKLPQQLLKAHIRFPHLPEKTIPLRTNDNGDAILPISIPLSMRGKYSVRKLLSNYVFLEYAGDSVYDYCNLYVNDDEYTQRANVQPATTKIEYIGTTNTEYLNDEIIPKDKIINLRYRISSKDQLLHQKSIQVFIKNNNKYELDQITISSNKFNEFVHNKKALEYDSLNSADILNKYNNITFKADIIATCSKVIDGDTIKVKNAYQKISDNESIKLPDIKKIRLVGVNTPEMGMLGADISKMLLEKLCLNKKIRLKIDEKNPIDKYGRTLAIVIIDSKNINQILLNEGLAQIMFIPPSEFNVYSWGEDTSSYGVNIRFSIKNPKNQTLTKLINSLSLVFAGDSLYKPFNKKNIELNNNKIQTEINYLDTWRSYKSGQVANIKISLYSIENYLNNYIDFRPNIDTSGSSDKLTVSYKMCNIKNNKGDFLTSFETNDERLIKNKKSEIIYCGMDTSAEIKYRLNTEVIQQTFINILNISFINGYKNNKEVFIVIDLQEELQKFKGDYEFISIETEDGDYALSDNQVITWFIGDIESNVKTNATIKIKANKIGLSKIKIKAYDYLHNEDVANNYEKEIGQKECEDCTKSQ